MVMMMMMMMMMMTMMMVTMMVTMMKTIVETIQVHCGWVKYKQYLSWETVTNNDLQNPSRMNREI